jgi:uncharacterized membrane protein
MNAALKEIVGIVLVMLGVEIVATQRAKQSTVDAASEAAGLTREL